MLPQSGWRRKRLRRTLKCRPAFGVMVTSPRVASRLGAFPRSKVARTLCGVNRARQILGITSSRTATLLARRSASRSDVSSAFSVTTIA
jgi:hypothetical protein